MKRAGSVILSVSSIHTVHPCPTTSYNSGMLQPQEPAPPKRCTSSMQGRSKGLLQYYPIFLHDNIIGSLANQNPLQ